MAKQEITTNEWTQITDLTSGTVYVLQATTGENDLGNQKPCEVKWAQQADAPTDSEEGIIADTIKADATVKIYVKVRSLPTIINSQSTDTSNNRSLNVNNSEQRNLKAVVEPEIIEEKQEEEQEIIEEQIEEKIETIEEVEEKKEER